MSTLGSLAPYGEVQYFDNSGSPLAGGLLYTYAAGSTTPLVTYADASLATPNTNPLVLDSAGRGLLYLGNAGYKFILQTSAAVQLWSVDNIYSASYLASNAMQGAIASTCQGRLTLTTGTPVTTGDVTAATTLRYALYKGNSIGLYDGSQWNLRTFTELSIAVPATTSQMYDVWVFDNSGTPALELLAWTNDTTRATALTTQDGVLVKTGVLTRRYVGSFRTTAVSGQTEDSFAKRYVWNYYNRVGRSGRVNDTTNTWTYNTATVRQANASTANQLDFVIGVAEVRLVCQVLAQASNTNTGVQVLVGIGEDSTSALATGSENASATTAIAAGIVPVSARLETYPAIGRHFYAWLEFSIATGTTTWIGDNGGVLLQSGISGSIEG